MKVQYLVPVLIFLLTGFSSKELKLNENIDDFSLVNALDQSKISLSDFSKSKVVVLVFSSPSCAFSKVYDERLVAMSNEFKNKEVSFIFINPNNPASNPEDGSETMIKRAKEKGYSFPYLIDAGGKTAQTFGASKTPEVFVLKNINEKFVLKYKGAIDNNAQLASEVKDHYLQDAINGVLLNTPLKISETKATGCMIRK